MLSGPTSLTPEQAKKYFKEESFQKKVDYYPDKTIDNSYWWGKGSDKLALKGKVGSKVFLEVLKGRGPNSETLRNKERNTRGKDRAAWDLTFSAPKSVSLSFLVGEDERLLEAHRRAVMQTLAVIEERYAKTRVRKNGGPQELVHSGNLTVAMFDHYTNRDLEPQLHTHCVLANSTWYQDKECRALVIDDLYQNRQLLGRTYQAYLAQAVQGLGYEIEPHSAHQGQFEIKGYQREQLEGFSSRRAEILAYAGVGASHEEREEACLATRKVKPGAVDRDRLLEWWKARAEKLEIQQPQSQAGRKAPLASEAQVRSLVQDSIEHCATRSAGFSREAIETFALNEAIGQVPLTLNDLQAAIDTNPELIQGQPDAKGYFVYTTKTALQTELSTIGLMRARQGQCQPVANVEQMQKALAGQSLTQGQRQAVGLALTSRDSVIAWQGSAGVGKTYALNQFCKVTKEQGYELSGFAPSAAAAKVLAQETHLPAKTVDRLLISPSTTDPGSGAEQIWIVDEAGLLDARQALRLLERAQQSGARVLLVGDIHQLSPVEAGKPFQSLQVAGMQTAYLTENLRQESSELREAVELLTIGQNKVQIRQALELLKKATGIQEPGDLDLIAERYLQLSDQERDQTLIRLKENLRQQSNELRRAVEFLSSGKKTEIGKGLDLLEKAGRIEEIANPDQRLDQLAKYYLSLKPEERAQTLILTNTHKERQELTERLRQSLKDIGQLKAQDHRLQVLEDKGLTEMQKLFTGNYKEGDVVVPIVDYTKKDGKKKKGYQLAKGQHYVVTNVKTDELTLTAADGSAQSVHPREFRYKKVYREPEIQIAVGDRLKWTENNSALNITNGEEIEITEIQGNIASYQNCQNNKTGLKATGSFDLTQGQHLTHALVSTVYSSQGKTAERVLFTGSKSGKLGKEAVYVAASRPKIDLRFYVESKAKLREQAQQNQGQVNPLEIIPQAKADAHLDQLARFQSSEVFWEPSQDLAQNIAPKTQLKLQPMHRQELVAGSAIHPDIAEGNFESVAPVDYGSEAWELLIYSEALNAERINTGRVPLWVLARYAHIDEGGWWASAGVDPRTFATLGPGEKPDLKDWGCFKPDFPIKDDSGKIIKYESPPKTGASLFLLDPQADIAQKIYDRYQVEPSSEDRERGFWYCAWKYNLPVTITEGAKKAASLLSQGYAAIGVPGINNGYRSIRDQDGNRVRAELHEELAVFATPGREIRIAFDYETRPNPKLNLENAIACTGELLENEGAQVSVVELPGPEKGVDDLIVAQGPLAYDQCHQAARRLHSWQAKPKQQPVAQAPEPPRKRSSSQVAEPLPPKVSPEKFQAPAIDLNVPETAELARLIALKLGQGEGTPDQPREFSGNRWRIRLHDSLTTIESKSAVVAPIRYDHETGNVVGDLGPEHVELEQAMRTLLDREAGNTIERMLQELDQETDIDSRTFKGKNYHLSQVNGVLKMEALDGRGLIFSRKPTDPPQSQLELQDYKRLLDAEQQLENSLERRRRQRQLSRDRQEQLTL